MRQTAGARRTLGDGGRKVIPLLFILLLALAVRAYPLNHSETTAESLARLSAVPTQAVGDPPSTYSVLATAAFRVFGWPWGARLLSVLAGVATVGLVYGVAGDLFGHRVAKVSALFAAVCPYLVYSSHLATSGSLTTFLTLAVVRCHLRAVAGGSRVWRWGYLGAFFLLATVDFNGVEPNWGPAVLVLAGLVVADLLAQPERPITRLRVAVAYLVPLVIVAPLFAYTIGNELSMTGDAYTGPQEASQKPVIYKPRLATAANVFSVYLLGDGNLKLGNRLQLKRKLQAVGAILCAVCFAAAGWAGWRVESGSRIGVKTAVALAGIPVGFAYLIQGYRFPQPTDFAILSSASGCLFLVMLSAGVVRLLQNRWTTTFFVVPMGLMILFALGKTYQRFGG